jgi:hypothetical protein
MKQINDYVGRIRTAIAVMTEQTKKPKGD